jgi:hypothetical protein
MLLPWSWEMALWLDAIFSCTNPSRSANVARSTRALEME